MKTASDCTVEHVLQNLFLNLNVDDPETASWAANAFENARGPHARALSCLLGELKNRLDRRIASE